LQQAHVLCHDRQTLAKNGAEQDGWKACHVLAQLNPKCKRLACAPVFCVLLAQEDCTVIHGQLLDESLWCPRQVHKLTGAARCFAHPELHAHEAGDLPV
jgi:hypothetical protein